MMENYVAAGDVDRRIAAESGVDCPFVVREVASDEEAHEIARTLNEDRRHMPREKRREVVADLRSQGHSLRAIAGAVGVSEAQVHKDLRGVNWLTPEKTTGLDGKRHGVAFQRARAGGIGRTPSRSWNCGGAGSRSRGHRADARHRTPSAWAISVPHMIASPVLPFITL